MPAPTLNSFAQDLYDRLAPLAYADDLEGYALAHTCAAIGLMFQPVEDLVRDTDSGDPGWAVAYDPDEAPAAMLPWLAQHSGITVLGDVPLSEVAALRARIKAPSGMGRGRPASIRLAASEDLTGSKTVWLTERHGSPWRMTVATLASETPSPSVTAQKARAQKPGGDVMDVVTIAGDDYASLAATHSDYADVAATFDDYAEIAANPTLQEDD